MAKTFPPGVLQAQEPIESLLRRLRADRLTVGGGGGGVIAMDRHGANEHAWNIAADRVRESCRLES
jgi:hypothetical protein